MIKTFEPRPYDGLTALPDYVTGTRFYTLTGTVPGDYTVTLARLTVGDPKSAGNPLTHVLFESFDYHGGRMKTARARVGGVDGVSGSDREFIAAKSAMGIAGVEFHPAPPCSCEEVLQALGEWYMAQNPEIASVEVMSQTCH